MSYGRRDGRQSKWKHFEHAKCGRAAGGR